MSEEQDKVKKNTAISIHFRTKEQLYKAYMPFIKGGGLFIPTPTNYAMGEEVKLLLKVIDDPEQYNLDTKVVWVSPEGAQEGRKPGVGLQLLGENGEKVRAKIDTYLAGLRNSSDKTETM